MARRLGESVHKKFNMTYRRIVEKYLNCNFGVAMKLDDVGLQSVSRQQGTDHLIPLGRSGDRRLARLSSYETPI